MILISGLGFGLSVGSAIAYLILGKYELMTWAFSAASWCWITFSKDLKDYFHFMEQEHKEANR